MKMVLKTSRTMNCWQLVDGQLKPEKMGVVVERELLIYVNGQRLAAASITPTMEKEFVAGYLFGQGFINALEDIETIEIQDNTAHVLLEDIGKTITGVEKTNYRIVSGGGRLAYLEETKLPEVRSEITLRKQDIYAAMNTLFKNAGLYGETEGVHAAGLFTAVGRPIVIVEDIGRHNTLDKIIGYVLMNKIDCSQTFLVSTGRLTSEMVAKICRCGIPIAATKTAVTDRGVDLAREHGVTLIGFVRDAGTTMQTDMSTRVFKKAGMKIYTGADRVTL